MVGQTAVARIAGIAHATSVTAQSTRPRAQIVNGARAALQDGTKVAAVGAVVGLPLALALAWRLRDLLYSTVPYDPLTLGVVLGALFLVVFAASLAPARKATLVDPAKAMRAD
jgi:predicted lysophospholipase L1 biosynthesis ABC-type transport system permease subunit